MRNESTPAETIAAAIEKLEKQKAAATLGPWNLHFADEFTARVGIDHSSRPTSLTGTMQRPNAELIVTLHCTIDPQLVILRKAHEQVSWYIQRVSNKDEPFTYVPTARRNRRIQKLWGEQLDLAKAILQRTS